MSTPRLHVVARVEVAAARPPALSDWAEEKLEETVELPADESMFEVVDQDRGGFRPACGKRRERSRR